MYCLSQEPCHFDIASNHKINGHAYVYVLTTCTILVLGWKRKLQFTSWLHLKFTFYKNRLSLYHRVSTMKLRYNVVHSYTLYLYLAGVKPFKWQILKGMAQLLYINNRTQEVTFSGGPLSDRYSRHFRHITRLNWH